MFKPELLSPAGTLKNMRYAFAYGADAVYAGQPRYSLRVRNNEFNHENLQLGINEAHALGKKFYVVVNIAPHNAKLKTFIRDLKPVVEMGPDALIMSDPGLIMLVREHFPEMPIHLSVQANAVNWATVKFWQQMGLTRVILSRELSLEEIEEIGSRSAYVSAHAHAEFHAIRCRIWKSKSSFTARCAWPTPVAACSLAISTSATRTRAPAPTPAAGSTTSRKGKKMTLATSYTSTSRFRCKMLSRRWVSARQPTKCL
ncbi:hypothetical protein EIMP300_41330 [Escherichia coli]|uniref:Protease n=1 Tax=Escherichia coli TaxID=562 RepID=A0A8S0FQK2_ECOLX|nr:hypothetical protein EIMP300_41330 [Escherichia coli]